MATHPRCHLLAAGDGRDTSPGSGVLSYKDAVALTKRRPAEPPESEEAEGGEDTLNGASDGLLHLQPDKSQTSSGSEPAHPAAHGPALCAASLGRQLNSTIKSSNQDNSAICRAPHIDVKNSDVLPRACPAPGTGSNSQSPVPTAGDGT